METIYKNRSSQMAALWNKNHPERAKTNRQTWANNHPEENLKAKRDYYWKHRERIRKEQNAEYPTKGRDYILRWVYGITLQDYNRMFQIQGGMCKICGKHQNELKRTLHVDHNHESGKVRGLLCDKCNMRVGLLEEKNWRHKAEKYLKEYE